MIGYHERSAELGNSRSYSNTLRTVPGTYVEGRVIASIIKNFFGWTKVSVFYTNDDFSYSANFFQSYANELGITILSVHSFRPNEADLSTVINQAKQTGARIFVLLMAPTDAYNLISEGRLEGLFVEDTQLIGGESLSDLSLWRSISEITDDNNSNGNNNGDDKLWEILKGFISVKWNGYTPSSPEVNRFISRYRSLPPTTGHRDNNGNMICDNTTDYYGYPVYKFQGPSSSSEVCCGVDYSLFARNSTSIIQLPIQLLLYC